MIVAIVTDIREFQYLQIHVWWFYKDIFIANLNTHQHVNYKTRIHTRNDTGKKK